MQWPTFCGESYVARSPTLAAETAINVFLETRQSDGATKQATWYGTPGLKFLLLLDTLGCRGWFAQDGEIWTVAGTGLYAIAPDTTGVMVATLRGTIADDGDPVSFACNGRAGEQLGVVSAGVFYVLDLETDTLLPPVSLPFSGPVQAAFLDGYTLLLQVGSPTVWFSALEDMTSFDALDFFTRSSTSDNLVGIGATRDRIWAFGSATTTLFYDSGDADTPFVPYPGTTIQIGLVSPWLMNVDLDVAYWVGETAHGTRRIVRATDPAPETISTPPIEAFLQRCTTLDDAEMLTYQQEGHAFAIVTCPSSPDAVQTYAFDSREKVWHARAGRDAITGAYTRWRARGCVAVDGVVYVGDYQSGSLYTLDLNTYADAGGILKRERAAPYLGPDNQWVFLDAVEIGVQPGVGLTTGQGSDPTLTLEVSRDGAHTWVNAGTAGLGAIGEYLTRCLWRKLGRARADRLVLRVTQTDAVKTAWVGAWLRMTAGTGAL